MGGICQRNQFCIRRARRPRRAVGMICPAAARRVVAPYQCGIIFSKLISLFKVSVANIKEIVCFGKGIIFFTY